MNTPTLYLFSGLPGSGKSTLAKELAKATGATYLRIDTIEQAIRDLCKIEVEGEGYRLAYSVAEDNLKIGLCVIADSCNSINLTRKDWHEVAANTGAKYIDIEIICSEKSEHKQRKRPFLSVLAPSRFFRVFKNSVLHIPRQERLIIFNRFRIG